MKLRVIARACALVVAGVILVGCVTPPVYGPIGGESGPYGYSDTRNADGSHTIRVVAMGAAQAHEFWDRRAGELCGGAEYRKIIYRAEIPVVSYTGYASGANGYGGSYTEDRYGNLILEGHARCGAAAAAAAETAPLPASQVIEPAPATPQQP
ncbi:MAG: hypothetical protein M0D54_16670 [Hyphomonadaceae bacterium JAD_PAG50586_4]|nr:MAG: hypothetical protein M0D54_16670 [Hyphomonadaceae bacterium JAD_PAG50586_4]